MKRKELLEHFELLQTRDETCYDDLDLEELTDHPGQQVNAFRLVSGNLFSCHTTVHHLHNLYKAGVENLDGQIGFEKVESWGFASGP
jgi:hypothetical protein